MLLCMARSTGWDDEFEALVAEICAKFIRDYDPAAEHCWIATLNGALVGSVFLVKDSDEIGRLRLLFVEPSARGHGIGRRLVDACVKRGREVGYRKVTLWTNDVTRFRPPHLSGCGLQAGARMARPQIRQGPRRPGLGARALIRSLDELLTILNSARAGLSPHPA